MNILQRKDLIALSRLNAKLVFALNQLESPEYPLGFFLEPAHASTNFEAEQGNLSLQKLLLSAIKNGLSGHAERLGFQKELLLIKNKDKYHFNAMMDPLKQSFEGRAEMLVMADFEKKKKHTYFRVGLLKGVRYYFKALAWTREAMKVYQKFDYQIDRLLVSTTLFRMMLALDFWKAVFQRSNLRYILVDTDHTQQVIPLLCAAHQRGISSTTLQHGSLDHTLSYYPVIAKEMWCWGHQSEKVLLEAGLEPERCLRLGNPVAKSSQSQTRTLKKVIGFAFSGGHLEEVERKVLENMLQLPGLNDFEFLLKLRPSVKPSEWMLKLPRTAAYETGVDADANMIFLQQVDLVVVSISSFGFEAIGGGVPLWVHRISDNEGYLDAIMIREGDCPDISKPDQLEGEIGKLQSQGTSYLEQLFKKQETYLRNQVFEYTGAEATVMINSQLEKALEI